MGYGYSIDVQKWVICDGCSKKLSKEVYGSSWRRPNMDRALDRWHHIESKLNIVDTLVEHEKWKLKRCKTRRGKGGNFALCRKCIKKAGKKLLARLSRKTRKKIEKKLRSSLKLKKRKE